MSGHSELGRGVIVADGATAPPPWTDCPRIRIDAAAAADLASLVRRLDEAWRHRERLVLELAIDPAAFRDPSVVSGPVWGVDPGLDLNRDRLHFLVWANNYDARGGEPIWWWARKAEALGASSDPGAQPQADFSLADGRAVWVDGGPRWSTPELDSPVIHSSSVEAGRLAVIGEIADRNGGAGGYSERDLLELDPGSEAEPATDRDTGPRLADLAPDQRAAVLHPGGPVRVIAPAGSGKTRVLTERVRHLLGERGYDRKCLLAVAYNKAAQLEIEDRLAALAPRTRTLNSLGYAICARYLGRRPRVLDELALRRLVEGVFPIGRRLTNTDPIGPYLDALTQVRLGLRDPAEVESERTDVRGLAENFDRFREELSRGGAIDFDEQIYLALEGLLRDGEFRRRIQLEHRHLLVDEFQDLTPAHLLMIRLLAMPVFDVTGVGDDDQTIYDHSGADPRFLVDYGRYFPSASEVALEVNYRCPEEVVRGAGSLLGYNRVRVEKRIEPARQDGSGSLELIEHPAELASERLVGLVGEWLSEVRPGQIAVLTRVNSMLLAPQIALWAAQVPVRSRIGEELLDRSGVAASLAWIRVAVDPDALIGSDLDLIRRRPSRGFPNWISKWFGNCRSIGDLRRIAVKIDDARVSRRVEEMTDDIEALAAAASRNGATTRSLLEFVRDRIGLGDAMSQLDGSKGSGAAGSHLDDLDALIQVADLEPNPAEFEPWLRAALRDSAGSRGVSLATIHRVKGREWDRVAVYGVNQGVLPHRLSENEEAERRVMHVAITRARDRCAVLGDASRRSPLFDEIRGTAPQRPALAVEPTPAARPLAAKPAAPAAIPETPLGEALRTWRNNRARTDGVPAYVVAGNRTLAAIATSEPADQAELLACEGIGPTKLERYGEAILELVAAHRHS